jgi:transcription elongation factor Elf1
MALTIRNGQFVDESGNVVKPEFGNPAQVSALKDKLGESWYKSKNFNRSSVTDEEEEEIYEGEMEMKIDEKTTYTFSLKFVCPKCNTKNTIECDDEFEDWEPDNDDVDSNFRGEVECSHCDQEFEYVHINREKYTISSKPKEKE